MRTAHFNMKWTEQIHPERSPGQTLALTLPLYLDLHWLPVVFKFLTLVYRALYGQSPVDGLITSPIIIRWSFLVK